MVTDSILYWRCTWALNCMRPMWKRLCRLLSIQYHAIVGTIPLDSQIESRSAVTVVYSYWEINVKRVLSFLAVFSILSWLEVRIVAQSVESPRPSKVISTLREVDNFPMKGTSLDRTFSFEYSEIDGIRSVASWIDKPDRTFTQYLFRNGEVLHCSRMNIRAYEQGRQV